MIAYKIRCKLFPIQFAGLVSAVGRASNTPPVAAHCVDQSAYVAALTVHAVLVDYARKLRCSATIDQWRQKDPSKQYAHTLPTAVGLAVWRHLKRDGAANNAEQEYLNLLDKALNDGHLLRPLGSLQDRQLN